ncbi:M23 family metallopeptidase [Ramlibacter monticola]|uniref:M23 family metallopeptidase n=1 Tax=Ramlibacter monticola TaxID=1926872 RepID=A0A936Z2I8_9BURK|nr:M23 family metallopeptidase [Ramlibacter monticola]
MIALVLAVLLASPLAAAQGVAPSLALPIQCRPGVDCEIQNYVDRDPGPGARDYQCGTRSYEGHDGIDFRLPSLVRQRQGVAVLAAADGQVARVRDGVADVSVRATGTSAVQGRECGNGVVIRHEGGFETQYCHLARGSIVVKAGDPVRAGDVIARVGLSGRTEYPHLHFTVREGRAIVDPFAYGAAEGACRSGRSLWRPELREALAYKPRSVLNTGFATQPLGIDAIDEEPALPTPEAAVLVAYARAIGLKAGDVQTLTLTGPEGVELASSTARPLPRDQAQSMVFAGVRRPAGGWPRGRYRGEYLVRQGGETVLRQVFDFTL